MDTFQGRGSPPHWWFGAPLLGVLFGFVSNALFPEFVQSAAAVIYRVSGNGSAAAPLSPDAVRFLAPLVGMLLAVVGLGAWRVVRLATRSRAHA
jgi:hypothetical protein